VIVLGLAIVLSMPLPAGVGTVNQTLLATIQPVAKLSLPPTVSLAPGATSFSTFNGAVPVSYRARTTPTGGGAITLQITSDFAPSGGPSVATGVLTYTCSGATLGTACSGTATASTSTQTPVLTLPASACTGGGGACSNQDPNSVSLNFTLIDDPGFATGTYSARVTLMISAT
jgi:hypothetical protein